MRLCEALGLTGANVTERRAASSGPESWSGIIEHVHQDAQQRYVLMRLDSPSSLSALVGVRDAPNLGGSPGANVSVCRYFYGDDAGALAADSETRWRDWLSKTFETQDITV